MARITVEDCVEKIPSRFELVMLAAQRARNISAGASLTIDKDNDKNPVIALREIADETLDLDHLRYELCHGLRRHLDTEDAEHEAIATYVEPNDLPADRDSGLPPELVFADQEDFSEADAGGESGGEKPA